MAKFGRIKSIPKLSKKESDAARELMANPKFKARMAKIHSTPVVKLYDIPFLCGYSRDAKVVYCDRHFNTKWKGVDLMKFLKIHEIVE